MEEKENPWATPSADLSNPESQEIGTGISETAKRWMRSHAPGYVLWE
jgi:hypothetical protein